MTSEQGTAPVNAQQEAAPEQHSFMHMNTTYGAISNSEHMGKMNDKWNDFCNTWVVDESQFEQMEDPERALFCARALRMFLMVFITFSTFGLIIGFVLKGSLENPMATEGYRTIDAPSVVLCPSPWGSTFSSFHLKGVTEGLVPGNTFHPISFSEKKFNNSMLYKKEEVSWSDWFQKVKKSAQEQTIKGQEAVADSIPKGDSDTKKDSNLRKQEEKLAAKKKALQRAERDPAEIKRELDDTFNALSGCYELFLSAVLRPRGKVAQYIAFDTVHVAFDAGTPDGHYNFGFVNGDGPYPQRWYSAALKTRNTGEISYDQLNVGASDVSEGIPHSVMNFGSMGTANTASGDTELEFFYGYFFIRILAVQKGGITIFALVAFILLLAASINNCGLFELFFQEYVPDDEPPPELEPNILCQAVCGKCFSSCRRKKAEPEAPEGETAEGEGDPASA
jgi:hypothetical protein